MVKSLDVIIKESLRECGLTNPEIAEVLPRLRDRAKFIGAPDEDSSYWDFRSKLDGVVDSFKDDGLVYEDYRTAALKTPQLFYQSPDTIESNITTLVAKFSEEGLTTKDYIKAALKQPSLFTQRPDTIESNITTLVNRFSEEELTTKNYLKAALKTPSLFCQSPDTIAKHIGLVRGLEYLGIIKVSEKYAVEAGKEGIDPVVYWLTKNPEYMTLSSDNLRLRFYYARLLQKPASMSNLTMSKGKVQQELDEAYGTHDIKELRKIYRRKIYS